MKIKEAYAKALNDHPFWTILISAWGASIVIRALRGTKNEPIISIGTREKPEDNKQLKEFYQ